MDLSCAVRSLAESKHDRAAGLRNPFELIKVARLRRTIFLSVPFERLVVVRASYTGRACSEIRTQVCTTSSRPMTTMSSTRWPESIIGSESKRRPTDSIGWDQLTRSEPRTVPFGRAAATSSVSQPRSAGSIRFVSIRFVCSQSLELEPPDRLELGAESSYANSY